jgi:hypothetical protein
MDDQNDYYNCALFCYGIPLPYSVEPELFFNNDDYLCEVNGRPIKVGCCGNDEVNRYFIYVDVLYKTGSFSSSRVEDTIDINEVIDIQSNIEEYHKSIIKYFKMLVGDEEYDDILKDEKTADYYSPKWRAFYCHRYTM